MDIQTAINRIIERHDLSEAEMQSVMRCIMDGNATPAQIGGFLVALRMKGETVDEIAAAAGVMRDYALKVEIRGDHLVDILGTGGDGSRTFNISTTAAFVVAAAGGRVAKHHNRAASSRSGSADVLEKAGVKLGLSPQQVAECVDKIGIGFMFAPAHHSATRHVMGPRRELGTRTIFNMLGPLTNPARIPNALLGVYANAVVQPVAQVMKKLGASHVMVVHAEDGMDEISISSITQVAELKDGDIQCYDISPEQFGLQRGDRSAITVDSVEDSLALMQGVLENQAGAARDIVLLNAGAAIYAAGVASDIRSGVNQARAAIDSGAARQKLQDLIALTHSFDK